MAELNESGSLEPDLVTCCDEQWDRNVYTLCKKCYENLWELPSPPKPQQSDSAHQTILEPQRRSIDILVCGRRITVTEGHPLPLGRQDEFETAPVFREAANVSRRHAVLRFADGRLYVTDTTSSNKTFVDDHELPPDHEYELRPGQQLRLASNVPVEILWET